MRKNILVIGASGYIGSATFKLLESHNIFGTYSQNQKIQSFIQLDLTSPDSIDHFIKNTSHLTSLDSVIFCHNALENIIFENSSKDTFLDSVNLDLANQVTNCHSTNVLYFITKLIPLLEKSSNPNIVFTGSLVGKKALAAPPLFSILKSIQNGLVENLSKNLGHKNIKVNSVDPGMLDQGMSRFICQDDKKTYLKHCGLERFGTSHDIAPTLAWFATENTFITGQNIVIDGGL